MIRTYKRKLILNKKQSQRINSWIGACRVVYNLGLEIQLCSYRTTGKNISRFELMRQCTQLRKEYDWIKDVPADSLSDSIKRLDKGYDNFFRTRKSGGRIPKFASKRTFSSFTMKQSRGLIKVSNNKIIVNKMGELKMFKDSPIIGNILNATIKIQPTGYFIYIQCKTVDKKFNSENQTIGLDMGICHFYVDSNGNFNTNPRHFKKYEAKLRIKNRALARKNKGSNSWKKSAKSLSLLHHKISNCRRDFLHKESTKIAKLNHTVYIEDLNIKGMGRNPNLSKHILDAGWGMFRTMLGYKTRVVRVNPKYTSQTCCECGCVDSKSRISQSEFACTSCGHFLNADINAAKNILSRGTALDRKRESIGCALVLESNIIDMSVKNVMRD